MPTHPNIVIFNPDSYRGDVLGHLGNLGACTPNIDALMAGGAVSYANAFAQNPVCTPSRCSFMTGLYPHVHGHRSMKNMLKEHEPNLFSVLQREGYHVWWGGKNDLMAVTCPEDYLKHCDTKYAPPPARGNQKLKGIEKDDPRRNVFYQGILDGEGKDWPHLGRDGGMVRGAVDFIGNALADQPFCVFLPLGNPHPAYRVERDFYDRVAPESLPSRQPVPERDLPALDKLREIYGSDRVSDEEWLDIKRIYYAMCTKVDDLFGQVVRALQDNGHFDNTLIIFMSDHGDFAGDYSLPEKTHFSLQDCLLRVPFVIRPPTDWGAQKGTRNHLVELVDMCPTIYDLVGIDPEYDTQGLSLQASLAGDDREIRQCIFAEVGARAGEEAFINRDVSSMRKDSFYALQSQASWVAHESGSYAVMCRSKDYKY
ncbi:MAG: sulfatase-like hydrolase/transferase, partial [Planctomycetota bacterium]|nr:sulfatase-like hydrolase/transferase [Planctomycetota bacterium]